MPQTTPTGGLSLIIHIFINLMVIFYDKIIKLFKISKKNFVSKSFATLINKKGDTFARRLLSYSLVLFVLVIMSGSFVLITTRLFKLEDTRLTTKIEKIVNEKYAYSNSSIDLMSEKYSQKINFTPLVDPVNQTFLQVSTTNVSEEKQVLSLVDFMKSLGIVSTSFKARAELAVESGVISNVAEYNGSLKQNREIIRKLKEKITLQARAKLTNY